MDEQLLAPIPQPATIPPTSTPHLKPANPHGKWQCLACARSIVNRDVNSHLSGNPHKRKQANWEASAHTRQQKDENLAVQQPGVKEGQLAGMRADNHLVTRVVPERAQIEVDVVVQGRALRPGMWKCDVCERVMMKMSKSSHLKGSPHEKAKQKLTDRMGKEAQEVELRRAREVAIDRAKQQQTELAEILRAKQIRIDQETREALQLFEQTRVEEEKQRQEEDQFRRVEEIRIAEEKRKELEEFQRTEQLRIDDEERRRARAVKLFEEEKQRKEVELQRAEQIRIEEGKQKRQQERDALRRTEVIRSDESEMGNLEELRRKQDTVIRQLTNRQGNRDTGEKLAINEEEQKEELRGMEGEQVDQEGAEKEKQREKEEAEEGEEADKIIRIERKVQNHELEKHGIESERGQGKEEDDICHAERHRIVTNDFPVSGTPANSIPSTGSLHHRMPGVQNSVEGTAEAPTHQAMWMMQYIHWQAMMQATYRQQVQQERPVALTYPVPITSATVLPPILYRVYDQTSVSKFTWEGFKAAAQLMPRDALHFKHMVQLHGNWSSSEGTPFVSVTSSPDAAAWHVTHKQASGGQTDIMVALIDTVALLGPCQTGVWEMHHARDHFGLPLWKCDRRAYDHEYICALRIPARAVIACCRPEYFLAMSQMFLKGLKRSD